MISYIVDAAHWLDAWLHLRMGRLYNAILGWGLAVSIVASLTSLRHALGGGGHDLAGGVARAALAVALQSLLLVNQLAQWRERRDRRRERRAQG